MASDRVDQSALRLFVDRIETAARALPRWDPLSPEPWHELVERQYKAELALARQLRAIPDCHLTMCSVRTVVTLALLGVEAHTKQGLAATCLLWAKLMREQLNPIEACRLESPICLRPVR